MVSNASDHQQSAMQDYEEVTVRLRQIHLG
jgi:hypothetical protein